MYTSNSPLQAANSETIHYSEFSPEDFRSKSRLGATGHRNQGGEEGKYANHAGEEGLHQPNHRVGSRGVHGIQRTHECNTL